MSSTAGTIEVCSGRWGTLCVLAGKRLAVVTPRGHVDHPVRQASGWIAWTSIDVTKELKRRARAEMERTRKRGQRYANDYYARCDDRCNRPRSDLRVARL